MCQRINPAWQVDVSGPAESFEPSLFRREFLVTVLPQTHVSGLGQGRLNRQEARIYTENTAQNYSILILLRSSTNSNWKASPASSYPTGHFSDESLDEPGNQQGLFFASQTQRCDDVQTPSLQGHRAIAQRRRHRDWRLLVLLSRAVHEIPEEYMIPTLATLSSRLDD